MTWHMIWQHDSIVTEQHAIPDIFGSQPELLKCKTFTLAAFYNPKIYTKSAWFATNSKYEKSALFATKND